MKRSLSQYVANNPKRFFESLPFSMRHTLTVMLDYFATPGYVVRGIEISNPTIAGDIIRHETVSRAISEFRKLGILETQGRGHTSNITFLTDWWRKPNVQAQLPKFFKRFPILSPIKKKFTQFAMNLALLISSATPGKIDSEENSIHGSGFKPAIRNVFNRSPVNERGSGRREMKQKIDKVVGIRAALLKRGEKEQVDPYRLIGFSEECLDYCIAEIRHATPKWPYRFFLKLAFDWCKRNNQEPDYVLADLLRTERVPEFESAQPYSVGTSKGAPAPIRKPGKYDKNASEYTKSNEQIVAKTKETQKRGEMENKKRDEEHRQKIDNERANLEDPFTKWVVQGLADKLCKVDYHSEDGKELRERLAAYGVHV